MILVIRKLYVYENYSYIIGDDYKEQKVYTFRRGLTNHCYHRKVTTNKETKQTNKTKKTKKYTNKH